MAAGISIFELFGSILVDNTKANDSISKTEQKTESLGSKFGSGVKTAAKWGAAIGAAATASGAALFGVANKASDAGDRIDKMSQKIGISSTAFQEFDYILGQNGADVEKLQVGLKTMVERMDQASKGSGKGAEAFGKLGLSVKNSTGELKSQEVMFEETAKALMGMSEGAEKSQLAFELFGKAGLELMPMLNGTAEDMDALKKKAHELGFVMDEESVKAAAQFNDSMDDMKKAMGGALVKIGIELMPMFQRMMDWVMDHMPEIQAVIKTVFKYIEIFVKGAIDVFQNYLLPVFEVVFGWVKDNFPMIQTIIKTVIDAIVGIITVFVDFFKSTWEKWGEEITAVVTNVWNVIYGVIEFIIKQIQAIIQVITALIKGDWEGVWEGIKNIFKNVWEAMAKILPNLLEGIFNILKGAFKIFTDIGSGMFNAIWDGMKGIWTGISNWVGEKVSWLVDKLAFWRKGSGEMESMPKNSSPQVDGSHANGLAYVPFNNYKANLHEGERVLTADENKNYNNSQSINQTVNIYSPTALSPSEVARENKKVLQRLALQL